MLFVAASQFAQAADLHLAVAQYPEGALWDGEHLYFEEMRRNVVRISDLTTTQTLWSASDCGPVNIAPYGGGFVVLCHLANKLVRISHEGETIGVIDRDDEGKTFVYPNGAAADSDGGVYFTSSGTFDIKAPAEGAVLYLAASGKVSRIAEGIRYANGIAVDSARKRLLVCAHLAREILTYPIESAGVLGKPSVFFSFAANGIEAAYPLAGPDGIEIDGDGNAIVAEYGAGRLHKIAADGTWLGSFTGAPRFVTDVTLLPDERAAVVGPESASVPPFWGPVTVYDRFLERFTK